MKSWKKLWKDQLDQITPALRDDVKNASIPSAQYNIEDNGSNTAVVSINNHKKWVPIVSAVTALMLCLVIILCVCLIVPTNASEELLFTLEINPSVTFSTDKNGIVTGVIASNADADILLADEDILNNIKGKSLEDAVTYITDVSAKLGYVDLNSTGSAVRISGLGSDDILDKAKSAVENYFTSKGVFAVVIAESVDRTEFALRSGISGDLSAKDISKYIKDSSVLFCDRETDGLSLQSIQSLYDQLVVADKLLDYVNDNLTANLERIINNAKDIENLSRLYFEIIKHSDNPIFLGDYWRVKKLYGESLSGEFAQLMAEMELALHNYKAEYGVDITSITQLKEAVSSYLKVPTHTLTVLLDNFSLDIFKEFASDIIEIMEVTGLISNEFANYFQLPQSIEDYIDKTLSVIKYEFNMRLENYQDVYNKVRQPIEKVDYDNFVDGIVEQYGSLNNYWQQIKN